MIRTKIEIFKVTPSGAFLAWEGTNVLTNAGAYDWVRIPLGKHLALGEGSQTPVPNITELANFTRSAVGDYATQPSNKLEGNTVTAHTQLRVLFPIEVESRNYTEVGIHDNDPTRLQTYAQLLDSTGTPVAITTLKGERLLVLYNLYTEVPATTSFPAYIAGKQRTVTQVYLQAASTAIARGPEALDVTYALGEVPKPLQPLTGAAGTAQRSGDIVTFTVPAKSSAQEFNTVAVGRLHRVGFHIDPPVTLQTEESLEMKFKVRLDV